MKLKNFLSLTVITLLILSLFSGCAKPKTPAIEETPNKIEETKHQFAETIEKNKIEGLYNLGTDITKEISNAEIKTGNTVAHICVKGQGETQVIHFSVYEDKILGNTTLIGEEFSYGALENDRFFAVNLQTAILTVYEKDGIIKSETQLAETPLSFAFLEEKGEHVVFKKKDSSKINKLNLKTKEEKESEESFTINGAPSYDDKGVYFRDTENRSYCVDFKLFTIIKTQTESFRDYIGPLGFAREGGYYTVTSLYRGVEKIMVKNLDDGERVIAANERMFITTPKTNQNYFRYYDFEQGMASEEIEDGGKVLDAQFLGEEYIFAALKNTTTGENFYRLLKIKENTKTNVVEASRLDETVLHPTIFPQKETATTDYGVRFLYGQMGEDFKTNFAYSIVEGTAVKAKLKAAEKIFEVIPRQLLMEATAEREIWVYLCKDLDNKGTEYTTKAGLTKLENHNLIFIDINCSDDMFIELLCHEFAHIIDDYIPKSLLDGFSATTPENIRKKAYTNEYKKISSDEYTPYSDNKKEVWFYNNFCRINEEEDRTITLGAMFKSFILPTTGTNFEFENVAKKAGYMTKMLEEGFDFCKENKDQIWEKSFPIAE